MLTMVEEEITMKTLIQIDHLVTEIPVLLTDMKWIVNEQLKLEYLDQMN